MENKFTEIFNKKLWGAGESVSGAGSSIDYTRNLRHHLSIIFKKFNIKSVIDAPCGDFNWMKEVVKSNEINYVGADIVKDIVNINNSIYRKENINFIHLDITKDKLPNLDLWICRDCLIHLSNKDILLALNNFLKSDIKYILTTTHIDQKNKDIESGDFRYIDLFKQPFNFPIEPLYRIEDYNPPFKPAEMILYKKEQLFETINKLKEILK